MEPRRVRPRRTRDSPRWRFNPPPSASHLDRIRFDSGMTRSGLDDDECRFVSVGRSAEADASEKMDEGLSW